MMRSRLVALAAVWLALVVLSEPTTGAFVDSVEDVDVDSALDDEVEVHAELADELAVAIQDQKACFRATKPVRKAVCSKAVKMIRKVKKHCKKSSLFHSKKCKACRMMNRLEQAYLMRGQGSRAAVSLLNHYWLTGRMDAFQRRRLKKILRLRKVMKGFRRALRKMRPVRLAFERARREYRDLHNLRWFDEIKNMAGDGVRTTRYWVKRIMKKSCWGVKCPSTHKCVNRKCIRRRGCAGINCPDGTVCRSRDLRCIKVGTCLGVRCPPGTSCRNGRCIKADLCARIRCPRNTRCFKGKCLNLGDPCDNVKCKRGEKCSGGFCVAIPKAKPVVRKPVQNQPNEMAPPNDNGWQQPDAPKDLPTPAPEGKSGRGGRYEWSTSKTRCTRRCGGGERESAKCMSVDGEERTAVSASKCSGQPPRSGKGSCGRKMCTVPDYKTMYKKCSGGSWTHCNCPQGWVPVSGGCDAQAWPHRFQYNNWNGHNGWLCGGHGGAKTSKETFLGPFLRRAAHVICAKALGDCKWSTSDGGDWHRNNCPSGSRVLSGGCNSIRYPWIYRWNMMSGYSGFVFGITLDSNGWLCGGWGGAKRTSVLCCNRKNMRRGCRTFRRRFKDWGHMSCPRGTKLISGGCDADKPYVLCLSDGMTPRSYMMRVSRPLNKRTWQCGGWGGSKLMTITCCREHDDY